MCCYIFFLSYFSFFLKLIICYQKRYYYKKKNNSVCFCLFAKLALVHTKHHIMLIFKLILQHGWCPIGSMNCILFPNTWIYPALLASVLFVFQFSVFCCVFVLFCLSSSCVLCPYVAHVSQLSIIDCTYDFLLTFT